MLRMFPVMTAVLTTLALVFAAQSARAEEPSHTSVTGQIGYLQRIALPPGSTATVTVSDVSLADAAAPVLAEVSIPGKQVPIPFEIDVPTNQTAPNGSYALQATIKNANGVLIWTTDAHIPVDPLKVTNDVGLLTLTQVTPTEPSTSATYTCGNQIVSARFAGNAVDVTMNDETHRLQQTRSASGARYANADETLVFWDRGITALLVSRGTEVTCTRQPVDLSGGPWRVEDINQQGVIDFAETSLEFLDNGQVSGRGGCNRFSGSYTREGATMTFGPMAVTQMACAPAVADQEKKFFQVLSSPVTISLSGNGALILENEAGQTLLARR